MQSSVFKKFETQHESNQGIIDYLFYMDVHDDEQHLTDCFLPNGCFEIILDLSDRVNFSLEDGVWDSRPRVSILGHHVHGVRLSVCGPRFQCLGVVIRPGKIANIIPDPKDRQYGKPIPLDHLFPGSSNFLVERIKSALSISEKVKILDDFIRFRISPLHKQPAFLDHSLQYIIQNKGNVSVVDISKKVHCSTRHLRRSFVQHFGVSPKTFSSVIRLFYTAAHISKSNAPVADVISDHGYFDRAHFYKEFVRIAGIPPSVYFNSPRKLSSHFFSKAELPPDKTKSGFSYALVKRV